MKPKFCIKNQQVWNELLGDKWLSEGKFQQLLVINKPIVINMNLIFKPSWLNIICCRQYLISTGGDTYLVGAGIDNPQFGGPLKR